MEDVDFYLRASKHGIRVLHLHSAQVFHANDTTVVGFCRQFFKYGFWERLVVAQHEEYPALLASSLEIPSI
jgi:GT2 family glycosyltransferase